MVNSGSKFLSAAGIGTNQKLMDEQRVPGIFGDDAHADAVGGIGAAEQILGEKFVAFRDTPSCRHRARRNGPASSPCCCPTRPWVRSGHRLHHEFVAGRAAGVLASKHDQGAVLGDMAFAPADRFLVKRGRVEIPMNGFQIAKARRFQTMGRHSVVNSKYPLCRLYRGRRRYWSDPKLMTTMSQQRSARLFGKPIRIMDLINCPRGHWPLCELGARA